jgi:hypothetical protein
MKGGTMFSGGAPGNMPKGGNAKGLPACGIGGQFSGRLPVGPCAITAIGKAIIVAPAAKRLIHLWVASMCISRVSLAVQDD